MAHGHRNWLICIVRHGLHAGNQTVVIKISDSISSHPQLSHGKCHFFFIFFYSLDEVQLSPRVNVSMSP